MAKKKTQPASIVAAQNPATIVDIGFPFDSGLALALRERWPSLVKDYRHDTHSKAIGAGELWAWTGVQQGGGAKSFAGAGVGAGNKINGIHDSDGLIKNNAHSSGFIRQPQKKQPDSLRPSENHIDLRQFAALASGFKVFGFFQNHLGKQQ